MGLPVTRLLADAQNLRTVQNRAEALTGPGADPAQLVQPEKSRTVGTAERRRPLHDKTRFLKEIPQGARRPGVEMMVPVRDVGLRLVTGQAIVRHDENRAATRPEPLVDHTESGER